jgi:hypothetical protein
MDGRKQTDMKHARKKWESLQKKSHSEKQWDWPFTRSGRSWNDTVKVDHIKIGCPAVDRSQPPQKRIPRQILADMLKKRRDPQVASSFLTSRAIISFWRKTALWNLIPYIFRTVHLRIIPVGNQLDAQFLLWYIYLNPLHVSSYYVLILRRTNAKRMNTASGIITLKISEWSKITKMTIIHRACNPDTMYYSYFSNFRSCIHNFYNFPPEDEHISCSKHVEDSNKCIKEEIVRQVG